MYTSDERCRSLSGDGIILQFLPDACIDGYNGVERTHTIFGCRTMEHCLMHAATVSVSLKRRLH